MRKTINAVTANVTTALIATTSPVERSSSGKIIIACVNYTNLRINYV